MKLRTRLMLAFLVIAVVPLIIIVLYSYYSSLETLRMAALSEVAELTAEIGDRIEKIRQDVDRGVEHLSTTQFSYSMDDSGELLAGERFLSEVGSAMGAAAPFVESLEFVPMPPEPTIQVDVAEAPAAGLHPASPPAAEMGAESVVIYLSMVTESVSEDGEVSEGWVASEPAEGAVSEILVHAEVAGHEAAQRWVDLDVSRLMAEARQLEDLAHLVEESHTEQLEREERVTELRRRVLMVEPMEVGESEMVWRPNLLEQEQVELLDERDRESRRLLGREFDSSVEHQGELIGRLRAQVSAKKVLQQVLRQAERDEGEIPFAVDGEGNVYTARETDRAALEGLPLLGEDSPEADGSKRLDDWVIVRLQDTESDLVYGIARPIGRSLAQLRRTAGRNLAAGLGLVALALLGIAPLSRRITRDLNTLAEGAEQLSTGKLDVRVPVRSRDEIGHLARTFNQMARDLEQNRRQLLEQERLRKEREIEHRLLEAENSRKGRELEDARLFQLSLLPKRLPEHPELEIGVFMQTATEVGGDYYDFSPAEDGSFTAVIGDATGHGARAGTMVTVIKSLFSAQAGSSGLAEFLDGASRSIRRMELGRMAMALTLARYRDGSLTVAAAGMPPILIRRAVDRQVEELALEGVPLGSMAQYEYSERVIDLAPGDTVLMMSDGFPELTNDQGEPMGYSAVFKLFGEFSSQSPQDLISCLAAAADDWMAGSNPSDDITFVALRVRS